MNRILQYIIVLLFLPCIVVHAKILRVNNDGSIQGVYASFSAAVGAAVNNDTIHIEGSVTPYTGNVTISKPLVIIGPGYLLSYSPETQFNKQSAKINFDITFASGSEGSVLAGIEHYNMGATTGFQINPTGHTGNKVIINTGNIKVINCKLYFLQLKNDVAISNVSLQKCFFNPGVVYVNGGTALVSGLSISNCFFRNDNGNWSVIHGADANTSSGWRISNNTFYWAYRLTVYRSQISDNAFFTTNSTNVLNADETNTYTNNVMNYVIGGMQNNLNGNIVTNLGVEYWFSRSGNSELLDTYYTSATNGTDCPLRDSAEPANDRKQKGMYGGGTPYVKAGMFRAPSVYDIQMDNEVGDQFDMTIRARVH
ncbi:MAG: hypothetical protein LBQ60_05760 [Bacteroidales bacterium]|jgi:hypothetical protein|nr:hypothetical protein [Bacteroidales bacterium]